MEAGVPLIELSGGTMTTIYDRMDPDERELLIEIRQQVLDAVKAHPDVTLIQNDFLESRTACCPLTILVYDQVEPHMGESCGDDECDYCVYDNIGELVQSKVLRATDLDTLQIGAFIDGWDTYPKPYVRTRMKGGEDYYGLSALPYFVLARELAGELLGDER
jgi:hypothetical protein